VQIYIQVYYRILMQENEGVRTKNWTSTDSERSWITMYCQLHAFIQAVCYITPSACVRRLVLHSHIITESLKCTGNTALLYHPSAVCRDDIFTFNPCLLCPAFLFHQPFISAKMITKTIWLYRMKSLKYMISILTVDKWRRCLHKIIKVI